MSAHNPAKIYMAAQYFFKSNNRGDTWWMNPTDLTKNVNRWAPEQAIMGGAGGARGQPDLRSHFSRAPCLI